MATSKKQPQFEIDKFFPGLQSLVTNLPTAEQKQEIDLAFTQLIAFLKDLQTRFQTIPSLEDADEARQFLSTLKEYLESAAKQPLLAVAFGSAPVKKSIKKPLSDAKPELDLAAALEELESMPSYELRVRLEKYMLNELKVIANEFKLAPPAKITKPDLVILIVGYFLNRRSVRSEDAPLVDASMKIPGGWPSN